MPGRQLFRDADLLSTFDFRLRWKAIALALRREVHGAHVLAVAGEGPGDERPEVEVLPDEAGLHRAGLGLPGFLGAGDGEAQDIGEHQDLPVALRAGADPDG